MVEVRFRSRADWERCCVAAQAETAYGPVRARLLGLRLQQLAAMQSMDDIVFLPSAPHERADHWTVTVSEDLQLIVSSVEHDGLLEESRHELVVVEAILTGGRRA